MKFNPEDIDCPECGDRAYATFERVEARAFLSWEDDSPEAEYFGHTDIMHDTQEVVTDDKGNIFLACRCGNTWPVKQVESV